MKRRHFLKTGGLGLTGISLAHQQLSGFSLDQERLSADWDALTEQYDRPPQVETHKRSNRVRSGMALGGIGTGGIELRKDGNFYNWSIFNNQPKGTGSVFELPDLPHSNLEDSLLFFLVRYQVAGEQPKLKILHLNDGLREGGLEGIAYYYPWMSGVEQIDYAARFPIINMRFQDPEMPFDIELEAFSPFIPHDIKHSALPVIYFDFKVKSRIDKPVEVTLVGTLRNLVGYDEVMKHFKSEHETTSGYKYFMHDAGGMDQSRSSYGQMGLGALGGDEVSYYLGWEHKHPYYEELLVSPRFPNIDDTPNRNIKTKDGALIGRVGGRTNDQRCFSSIAVSRTLQAEAEMEGQFFMNWYFPNAYGAIHDRDKLGPDRPLKQRYTNGLKPTKRIGHYYENFFAGYRALADYCIEQKTDLRQRTRHFMEGMYATTTDLYILDQVNSHFNTFITSATLTKNGSFGIREGLTPSKSWGPNITADVSLYGSVMITGLFPELAKTMMRLHRNLQTKEGSIHHGLGYDLDYTQNGTFGVNHRVDLTPNYIQMVLRDYLWTNDKAYLEEMWPSVKKGIDYVLRELDQDGDQMPDMHGIMCSYDNFPMYGLAAYLQSQWVAAMSLAGIAAADMGEAQLAKKYREIADRGKQLMEDYLWNGSYFRLANDYHGEKGKDEGCLTDQLIGQWVAHTAGLGRFWDKGKIRKALQSVLDYSFIDGQFLRNCTWPEHRDLFPIQDTNLWVDQANTPWTGVELGFASFLIYEGMIEEGKAVIKAIDDRYRKAGLYWDHQEFGGHYYRPMSAWATMNALAGLSIVRNEYRFNPPRLTKGTDRFFFAASTGTGLFIADEKGRCGIKAHSGFLELQSLGLSSECWAQGKDAGLLLNGQKVEIAKWTEEPECLVAHFVAPLKIQEGKMLKVV
ncbi:MAG: GH116 family glycosyl hydrolase [Phaeodactylibacter sp.]|uniref:GH116 family glycosyl hydrolase n=1 Tax=Phaeodactylibacter sp. TaxID=1940289 RepID=UPI0032ECE00E